MASPNFMALVKGRDVDGLRGSFVPAASVPPILITAATTLTAAAHAGRTMAFNVAAGVTVTLPPAKGTGAVYRFVVLTTVTSSNDVIQVGNTTDIMQGTINQTVAAATDLGGYGTAADSDTITLNGSTKGGIKGDWIELTDIAAGLYLVAGSVSTTGTAATPFSAAV
jgi:hypothetical protein